MDPVWQDKVWAAYRHALVRFEIARQDLAVARAEKDGVFERDALERARDWGNHCVRFRQLVQSVTFAKKSGPQPLSDQS